MTNEALFMSDAENSLMPMVFPDDIGLGIPDLDSFDFSFVG